MAKYGEGDKRWIVQDRPDGTNVHNWHWAETDCLEWTRNFFNNSLTNLALLNNNDNKVSLKTNKVDKLEGEAYVNVRKGKIIPGYEISMTVSFEGECDGKNVDGVVEIPYISDENADEDPELKVVVKNDDGGPVGKRVKEAMIGQGNVLILEKVRAWVECMAKGGPVKDDLEAKNVVGVVKKEEKVVEKKDKEIVVEKKEVKKVKKGFKNISLSERFNCRARDLFEILMDENRWKGFTQSNARISKEVGGEFSIFDGSVTGVNIELQEGKLIVQKWRFGSWPDGVQSTVRLAFEEAEPGVTVVKLTHTDVPEEDRYGNATVVENTERGWRDLIFNRIRAVFGFGI